MFFVKFGDVDCTRLVLMFEVQPCFLCANGNAAFCADDNDCGIRNTQCFRYFADKVKKARSVQDIDFMSAGFNRANRGLD